MAATTGPYSFVQYYQNVNEPIIKDIWMSFIKAGSLFTRFPMDTVGSLKKTGKRVIGGLPTPTFLQIGQEPPTPFVQDLQDYEEGLALIRDNFDIDRVWMDDKWYVKSDPTRIQIESYLQGRAFALNNYLINNSRVQGPIDDANGFVGLKYRLAYPNVYGNNSACQIQSTADLSDTGLSGAGAIKIMRDIQLLLDHMGVEDGTGVVGIGSPQFMRQLNAIIKTAGTAGGFEITKDAFDRSVVKYKNMEIVSCGYQAPLTTGVQIAPIISDAEDANGWDTNDQSYNATGAVYTSLYMVRGGENYFSLWQQSDPWMVKERVSGTRKWRVMFDMTAGVWCLDTRAIGRIYGIKTNGIAGD